MTLRETREVRINGAYWDYTPPINATALVNELLRTVPQKYLTGLDCIVLTNESGLSRKDRVGRVWSRKRHIHRTIRPEHTEKEDVADEWAGKLKVNFIRKKYWYGLPILIPAFKVYKFMRRKQWI